MRIGPVSFGKGEQEFGAIQKEYSKRLPLLEKALEEAKRSVAKIRQRHRKRATLRIAYIDGRVKELASIIAKASEKNLSAEQVWGEVSDIVGVRVVVNNLFDIEPFIEELSRSRGFSVLDRQCKDEGGGYKAEHLQMRYSFEYGGKQEDIACEMQVRTLLQDAWARLTHRDVYKNQACLRSLAQGIPRHLSESLTSLDELADAFRREVAQEVEPPNDLSDDAALDRQGIAFLYYEVLGKTPQEYEVQWLLNRARECRLSTVGEARKGLGKDVLDRLRNIHDTRFLGLPLGTDALEYGMLYAAEGAPAFGEYSRHIESEWQEIEAVARGEILAELPESYEEFVEELRAGNVSWEAVRELGGFSECLRCGTEILCPDSAAEAVLAHFNVDDPDGTKQEDLEREFSNPGGMDAPLVEDPWSSMLCDWCAHIMSKDD